MCTVAEGRQYKRIWVHAAGLQGEDNQLLTMISRGMSSPWDGGLKVDGIRLERYVDGSEQKDLNKKMKPYGKSLLVAKLLGKDVEQDIYNRGAVYVIISVQARNVASPRHQDPEIQRLCVVVCARAFTKS